MRTNRLGDRGTGINEDLGLPWKHWKTGTALNEKHRSKALRFPAWYQAD